MEVSMYLGSGNTYLVRYRYLSCRPMAALRLNHDSAPPPTCSNNICEYVYERQYLPKLLGRSKLVEDYVGKVRILSLSVKSDIMMLSLNR